MTIRCLYIVSHDRFVRGVDHQTGNIVCTFDNERVGSGGLAVGRDGTLYVSTCDVGVVRVLNRDGIYLRSMGFQILGLPAGSCLFNGLLFVANYDHSTVEIFNAASGFHVTRLQGNGLGQPVSVSVSTHGEIYVANWAFGTISVFFPNYAPKRIIAFTDTPMLVSSVAVSSNGSLFVANHRLGQVFVCSEDGSGVRHFVDAPGVSDISFTDDHHVIVAATCPVLGHMVRVYTFSGHQVGLDIKLPFGPVAVREGPVPVVSVTDTP